MVSTSYGKHPETGPAKVPVILYTVIHLYPGPSPIGVWQTVLHNAGLGHQKKRVPFLTSGCFLLPHDEDK